MNKTITFYITYIKRIFRIFQTIKYSSNDMIKNSSVPSKILIFLVIKNGMESFLMLADTSCAKLFENLANVYVSQL